MSGEKKSLTEEPLSRRRFLGGIGGAAVALTVGSTVGAASPAGAATEGIEPGAGASVLTEAAKQSPQMARAAARRGMKRGRAR